MAWLEGAIVKKVTRFNKGGSKAQLMSRHDGMVEHVAVSNGASLFTFFNTPGEACSHFYVRKAGPKGQNAGMADFEQYVDTAYIAPAQLDGNHRMLSCETQGGVGSDVNNGWTVAQINRLAWIAYECHRLHGYPLVAMHDSKPTSRGIGYHRLGVDPWRVSAGEHWSDAYGKVCPGPAREKQVPLVISKAVALGAPAPTTDWLDMATQAEVQAAVAAGVEAGIANYLKRFFTDGEGTGDAIWDDERAFMAATAGGFATIGEKLDGLPAAIGAAVAGAVAPKA
jgi:hypothetical protein